MSVVKTVFFQYNYVLQGTITLDFIDKLHFYIMSCFVYGMQFLNGVIEVINILFQWNLDLLIFNLKIAMHYLQVFVFYFNLITICCENYNFLLQFMSIVLKVYHLTL